MYLSPDPMVRPPAAAGLFYPADPTTLRHQVHSMLQDTAQAVPQGAGDTQPLPKALIVPHAGYAYSGPTAAAAFARLMTPLARDTFQRVLVIGPAHRVPVQGLAASSAIAFATPLGDVPVDQEYIHQWVNKAVVKIDDKAHGPEHSLEVELPFLREVLGDFKLLPVVFGKAQVAEVVRLLEPMAAEGKTLIVVSSDLSHYQPDAVARAMDARTAEKIESFSAESLQPMDACGHVAIAGLLKVASMLGWRCQRLDMRNSGAAPGGDLVQVVGYGAWMFW